jgi:hypothetical protein
VYHQNDSKRERRRRRERKKERRKEGKKERKNPSKKGLVEWLKVKALSSSPSTAKKKKFHS